MGCAALMPLGVAYRGPLGPFFSAEWLSLPQVVGLPKTSYSHHHQQEGLASHWHHDSVCDDSPDHLCGQLGDDFCAVERTL